MIHIHCKNCGRKTPIKIKGMQTECNHCKYMNDLYAVKSVRTAMLIIPTGTAIIAALANTILLQYINWSKGLSIILAFGVQ